MGFKVYSLIQDIGVSLWVFREPEPLSEERPASANGSRTSPSTSCPETNPKMSLGVSGLGLRVEGFRATGASGLGV